MLNQRLIRRLCSYCQGNGCTTCLQTGYKGRLPLVEWLRVNDVMRQRVALRQLEGFVAKPSLAESAEAFTRRKLTSKPEVSRVLGVGLD